jgi:hypothetical protein
MRGDVFMSVTDLISNILDCLFISFIISKQNLCGACKYLEIVTTLLNFLSLRNNSAASSYLFFTISLSITT